MKYIIIDDNTKYAERLLVQLKEEGEVISSEGYELNELAREIQGKANNQNGAILLISINLKAKNKNRQEQAGIELLIWLRIKEVLNHVVLYSFETLHSLLNRNPKHLIATSQGTTFVQLPDTFKELNINLIKKKEDKKNFLADPENIREAVKPAFSIEKFRHREANWWGVKQLWDIHNLIYDMNDEYPPDIVDNLKRLDNYIAKVLYEYNDVSINEGLRKLLAQKSKGKNNNIDAEIQNRLKRMGSLKNEISQSNLTEKDEKRKRDEILRIKSSILKLESEKEENINIDKVLFVQELAEIKEKIKESNPVILYIDDNAGKGWADILKRMLGDVTLESVVPIDKYKNRMKDFYTEVVKPLLPGNYTLMILDLRLFDEIGLNLSPEKLSGSLLLREMQDYFPEIPVLVTTASNKTIVYKTLITLGADAFWIKEGIDEHKEATESIAGYWDFIDFVKKLHSREFSYLGKLIQIGMGCNETSWWHSHTWINDDKTSVPIEEVKDIIKQSVKLYKAYLHRFYINTENNESEKVFFLTSLINKLGLIVELIHGIKNDEDYRKLNSIIYANRVDTIGETIRKIRNDASHAKALDSTIDSFFTAVDLLNKYLLSNNDYTSVVLKNPSIKYLNKCVFLEENGLSYKIVEDINNLAALIAQFQNAKNVSIKHNLKMEGIVTTKTDISFFESNGNITLNPAKGFLLENYFIAGGNIYKINKPAALSLASGKQIVCKLSNSTNKYWEPLPNTP